MASGYLRIATSCASLSVSDYGSDKYGFRPTNKLLCSSLTHILDRHTGKKLYTVFPFLWHWAQLPHLLQLICFIIPDGSAESKVSIGNGLRSMQASKLGFGIFFREYYLVQNQTVLGTINSGDNQTRFSGNDPGTI